MPRIETDICIIGAGPVGLFAVFEAGLLQMKCHLVDSLPQVGGQCSEIYPNKPIYDIPGLPAVNAGVLIQNLMEQIAPFHPTFTLGERAETCVRQADQSFLLTTNAGTEISAKVIVLAAGLGCFEPRKPPLENIDRYEGNGIDYFVKDPEKYRNKEVLIAGGGDSALDWTIFLAEIASKIVLVHRRIEWRAAPDSVHKMHQLVEQGKVQLITNAQITKLQGEGVLESCIIQQDDQGEFSVACQYFLPLFGLTPKLGPIANWGLQLEKNAIVVDTLDYSTNEERIYAIGDINTYPGKLKLILCGFHEATLMCQSAYKYVFPDKKLSFKYTTVTGIPGATQTH